jgi:hypothetical protein
VQADELLRRPQYSLSQRVKRDILTDRLRELTLLHRDRCEPYNRILAALNIDPADITSAAEVPMLPVGLFKRNTLRSIPDDDVFKVVTSSGPPARRKAACTSTRLRPSYRRAPSPA